MKRDDFGSTDPSRADDLGMREGISTVISGGGGGRGGWFIGN